MLESSAYASSFNFFGTGYTTVYVDSNGRLNFFSNVSEPANSAFPCAVPGCGLVLAPFWEDLTTANVGSEVRWASVGAPPNRRVVITWTKVAHSLGVAVPGGVGDSNTFQAILSEGTNGILFQYQSIHPVPLFGKETVGLNHGDGCRHIAFDPATLSFGSALAFTP